VLDGGVLGAILRTPRHHLEEQLRRQIEHGFPIVIVFPENPTSCPSNAIDVDNVAAGWLAAKLLREAGRQRLLLIQDEVTWEAVRLREQGFMAVSEQGGATIERLTVPARMSGETTEAWLAERLGGYRPDGIYTASSVTGVEALLACRAAGLKVPEETALVGSDAALWRAPGCPPITSVDVSWYSVGELAVRKMMELEEQGEATFANIAMPPRIRVGGTCPISAALLASEAILPRE
jgi:DNA-binding LacI/PurR family transcriptional regulator